MGSRSYVPGTTEFGWATSDVAAVDWKGITLQEKVSMKSRWAVWLPIAALALLGCAARAPSTVARSSKS